MIDFKKIRERPSQIYIELLINAPQLLLMFYGLKCLVTLQGKMLLSVKGAIYSSLHLVPVNGTVAIIIGLLYFGLGLFFYLSDGNPPPENGVWFWRIGRSLLRWGSLAVALFCLIRANYKLSSGPRLASIGFSSGFLIIAAIFISGMITLVSFLSAMFQQEEIKRDLEDRGCQPLHIWWRPAAYWLFRYWFGHWGATGFRVIFADPAGLIHKGYCLVYRSFLRDWRWGNRQVRWLADTVTDQPPAAEVWADSEVLRPNLKEWDEAAGTNDLLENPDKPPD
jgi:hypothetical protein